MRFSFGRILAAEQAGRLTVRENGTLVEPGVIVGGANVQVAPAGSELFKHDNVNACLGSPVFAASAVENVAELPAEAVCDAGDGAVGAGTIRIG